MKKVTAGIFLIFDNKILVTHPTNHPWSTWSIPKGMVDKGETTLQAAKRETLEETNLNIDDIKIDKVSEEFSMKYKSGKKTLKAYFIHTSVYLYKHPFKCDSMVLYLNGKKLKKPFPECDAFKWVTVSKAKGILHEAQVKILNSYDKF